MASGQGSPGSSRHGVYESKPQLRVAVPQRTGSNGGTAGEKRAAPAAEERGPAAPPAEGLPPAEGEPHIAAPTAKRQRLELP